MTWAEFDRRCQVNELNERKKYELSRWATFHLINIQLSKKDKIATPFEMFPFPWEQHAKKQKHTNSAEDEAAFTEIDAFAIQFFNKSKTIL